MESKKYKDINVIKNQNNGVIEFVFDEPLKLYGNILLKLKHMGSMTVSNIFRISFNTAFVPYNNTIKIDRLQIGPEDVHKDFNKIPNEFYVDLKFADYCETCRSYKTPIN